MRSKQYSNISLPGLCNYCLLNTIRDIAGSYQVESQQGANLSMGGVPKKHGIDQNGVKKGPWSVEEDEKLVAYIRRCGIWNWNQMAKPAGLSRSGKSCRLRWMNYLRPNIRHGNITKEEEEIIVNWHQLLGNRWSAIAAKLHGRTDNEIKNYWNTRLKRRYGGNNIHPIAVNPPKFPATTCAYEQTSIQHSSGISITPVHNGTAQDDEINLHESIFWKAPAVATNDFCSSNSPNISSNDTGPLGLSDELQTLLTQMFPTYTALDDYYHEKSGYTSTSVASQAIDGTTDLIDQHIIFDLWE